MVDARDTLEQIDVARLLIEKHSDVRVSLECRESNELTALCDRRSN